MKKRYSNKKLARKPLIMALEPRLLLDGAAVATAVDVLTDAQLHQDAFQSISSEVDASQTDTSAGIAPTEVRPLDPTRNSGKKEVVFIDSNVTDYQTLLAGIKEGVEVVLLDGSKDGLAQMATWAQGKSGYDSIHVMSHGAEGQIQLGSLSLGSATAQSRAADLSALGSTLNAQGDLLVYGCSVASGEGQEFIAKLAELTQADVAASDDVTGAASKGGNWILEKQTGDVDSTLLNSGFAASYAHLLETITFVADSTEDQAANSDNSFTRQISGAGFTFAAGSSLTSTTAGYLDIQVDSDPDYANGIVNGIYALSNRNDSTGMDFSIKVQDGYSFDLTGFKTQLRTGELKVYYVKHGVAGIQEFDFSPGADTLQTYSNLDFNDITEIVFTSNDYGLFQDLVITDVKAVVSDTTAPTFDSANSTPADNASNVAVGDNIVVDFSEDIQFGANGTITLRNVTQGQNAETFNVTNISSGTVTGSNGSTLTISGDKLTLNPNSNLLAGTQYSLRFDAGSIEDTAGNDLAAISDDTTFNFTTAAPANTAPVINNLNGDTREWPNGTYTFLDDFSTIATVTDGEGNWNGGSLVVQRTATGGTVDGAWAGDEFSFNSAYFTATATDATSGTLKFYSQAAGQSFASYTNVNGVLTITFNSNATSEMVGWIFSGISYQNDTPAGDVSIGFTLTDGAGASTTATTTVTSDTIYVTNATDTSVIDVTDGISFSEAVAIAAADTTGTQTLVLTSALANSTITLAGNISLSESLTIDADDASGLTITGSTITTNGSYTLTFRNGASDTLTVATSLAGAGDLTKTGAGTLVLGGTNNTASTGLNTITVSAGTLQISDDNNLGTGEVNLGDGATFTTTTSVLTVDNDFVIDDGNSATIYQTGSGHLTLSGANKGSGALTKSGDGKMTLSGDNGDFDGGLTITGGTVYATSTDYSLGFGAVKLNGGTLDTGNANTIENRIEVLGESTISNSNTTALTGVISGSGKIIKAGIGTLTLSNTNNEAGWSGDIVLTEGTLSISNDNALSSGSLLFNGGRLAATASTTIDNAMSMGVNGGSNGDGSIDVDVGVALTLSATSFGGGGGQLEKLGEGTLVLGMTSANQNVGHRLTAGTLEFTNPGSALSSSNILILNGGTLSLSSGTLAAEIIVDNDSVITASGDAIISGIFSGSANLTKTGSAQLTLTGNNSSFDGAITISAGSLVAGHANALGSTTGETTVSNGATLGLSGGVGISENIVLDSNTGSAFLHNISGDNTLSGTITHSSQGGARVSAATGTTLTLSGEFAGGGSGNGSSYDLHFGNGSSAGTVVLSGANTFKDAVFMQAGTLVLANNLALGDTSQGITEVNGGTLALQGGVTISGENIFDFFGGTISNLGGDNSFTGKIQKLFTTLNIDVATGSTLTLSGQIGDNEGIDAGAAGGLTKNGAGTLVLSGTNLYKGNTTVSAGTLSVSSDAALGASWTQNGSGTLDSNVGGAISLDYGTTLAITGATSIDNAIAFNGDATITNANAVTLSGVISDPGEFTFITFTKAGSGVLTLSGTNTHSGYVTVSAGTLALSGGASIGDDSFVNVLSGATLSLIGGAETIGALGGAGNVSLSYDLTMGNMSSTSFSGVISSTNTSGIIKVGTGRLELTGANTYTGTTTVSEGKLWLLGGASIADSSAVTISSGAELELRTTTETIGSLAGAGRLTLNGGTLTVGGDNTSTTFSGIIQNGSSAGGLTKMGTGTLTLSGNNTYTGNTAIFGGVLAVGHNNALGTTAGATTVSSGATLQLADGISIAENLTISGNGVSSGIGAVTVNTGSASITGNITMASSASLGAYAAGDVLSITGNISNAASGTLQKVGDGTLALSGTNTVVYIWLRDGTLDVGSTEAIGNANVYISDGSTLRFSTTGSYNNDFQMDELSIIDVAVGVTATISTVSSSDDFSKTGAGTLAMDTSGTFELDATNVVAGMLLLTGGGDYYGDITVKAGATLGGSARLYDSVTVESGGTLAPGVAGTNNGVGTLTVNYNLTLASGAILAVDIAGATAGTGYDQVVVNGTVNVSNATITPTLSYTPGNGDAYVIISNNLSDSIIGNFNGLNQGGTINSAGTVLALTGSYSGGTSSNDFTLTA
ncbi:MAG: DUF4347 domain-containing protein, partial [Pararheinheimera sp.]|nr:DUF4347 domain-containing protein [Rheinheimera sp.]